MLSAMGTTSWGLYEQSKEIWNCPAGSPTLNIRIGIEISSWSKKGIRDVCSTTGNSCTWLYMPVPGFTSLYLGLLWSVLDHQRMVLDAQTYTWDGWMGWKSWNASLLWGHPDCPECINSGKTVRGGQFRSKNVCIFLYSELTCWS